MDTITWLHLSDLHFRESQQHTWDESIVLKTLLVDVAERIAQDGLKPDFAIVTGDIAFSGKPKEYKLAQQFFDRLLQVTQLGKDRLFIVPGNHDVDRDLVTQGAKGICDSLIDRKSANAVLSTPSDRRLMLSRLNAYAAFITSYLGEHLKCNADNYFYVRTLGLAGQQVAVLGLNSAWLAYGGDDDRGRLILSERQARPALDAAQAADLCLALMHHPFDWLRDFDRSDVESLLCRDCDFILHGHMHQIGLLQAHTPDTKAMLISAGACYDTRERPNSYNIVRLDPAHQTGVVHLRMYSDRQGGFWAKDVLNYRNVSDGRYEFTYAVGEHKSPKQAAKKQSKIFICYKRNVERDQRLAQHLYKFLTARGHDVFIDATLRAGEAWLEEIDRQIKASDFLVVLLSQESADSEMVQAEVRRAYEYRKLQGHPNTLPVRIAYEGLLPYSIDAFLDPLQYIIWQSDADAESVGAEILAAIEGRSVKKEPIQTKSAAGGLVISEDGRPVANDESLHPPLPEFDPRFLEELEVPGGAVKPRDRFYIEREDDARLNREIVKSGTTTTIRAARQTGKSSLLVRGVHHARQKGAQVVCLDMQRVDSDRLASPDIFLRDLAELIVRKLHLDGSEVDKTWRRPLGAQDKLTSLIEDYVLPKTEGLVVLALDEADRLLQTTFHKDFFALIRSWHNSRAFDDQWNKLNVVLVISTEPYLLIADLNQSPFNVGLKLYLEDFNGTQVRELNRRHGSPVKTADFSQFLEMFGGHPYLTRKALYTLVTEQVCWADLLRIAPTDQGPFGDHLRHHHWLLRDEPALKEALKQVIQHQRCVDEMALFRLLRAGLVKGSGDVCKCRCALYELYFKDKLR